MPRPLLLNCYTSSDAKPYTAHPQPTRNTYKVVRGEPVTWAHHDPRPCQIPPNWAGGYSSIYAAQAGLGIAQVPLSMAQQAIARGELVELLPEAALEGVGIYVVYPSRKYLTPAVRAFVDLVVEAGADVLKQDLPPLSSKA